MILSDTDMGDQPLNENPLFVSSSSPADYVAPNDGKSNTNVFIIAIALDCFLTFKIILLFYFYFLKRSNF